MSQRVMNLGVRNGYGVNGARYVDYKILKRATRGNCHLMPILFIKSFSVLMSVRENVKLFVKIIVAMF